MKISVTKVRCVVAFGKLIYSWRRHNSWWAAFVFKQKFTHWSSPRYYFNADNTTRSKRLDCLTWSPLTTVRYKRVFHLQKNDNAIVKKGFWNLAVWEEKWVTYLRFQSGQVDVNKRSKKLFMHSSRIWERGKFFFLDWVVADSSPHLR